MGLPPGTLEYEVTVYVGSHPRGLITLGLGTAASHRVPFIASIQLSRDSGWIGLRHLDSLRNQEISEWSELGIRIHNVNRTVQYLMNGRTLGTVANVDVEGINYVGVMAKEDRDNVSIRNDITGFKVRVTER